MIGFGLYTGMLYRICSNTYVDRLLLAIQVFYNIEYSSVVYCTQSILYVFSLSAIDGEGDIERSEELREITASGF